jgi:hypothetical protein
MRISTRNTYEQSEANWYIPSPNPNPNPNPPQTPSPFIMIVTSIYLALPRLTMRHEAIHALDPLILERGVHVYFLGFTRMQAFVAGGR